MTTDFRALCARMADELDHYRQLLMDDRRETHALATEARAAIAADRARRGRPTPQPPITPEIVLAQREEILAAFIAKHGFDPDSAIQIEQRQEDGTTTWRIERTPQTPEDGEVTELVETLKGIAYWRRHGKPGNLAPTPFDIRQADRLDRAAELLERFASPACLAVNPSPEAVAALKAAGPGRIEPLPDDMQIIEPAERTVLVPPLKPVPVSERLPGAEDCGPWPDEPDAVHWCWFGSDTYGAWLWEQRSAGEHTYRHLFYTHWLPAGALPLPTSEVAE